MISNVLGAENTKTVDEIATINYSGLNLTFFKDENGKMKAARDTNGFFKEISTRDSLEDIPVMEYLDIEQQVEIPQSSLETESQEANISSEIRSFFENHGNVPIKTSDIKQRVAPLSIKDILETSEKEKMAEKQFTESKRKGRIR